MKCTNCGFEHQEEFQYCANCGAPASAEPVSLNPVTDKILPALKDNLFLAICILMTVSCALSILSGSLPIVSVLITIFLWITYSQARKDIADDNQLRCVSGAVYANYVIINVVSVIFIVCGVILAIVLGFFMDSAELVNAITLEIGSIYPNTASVPQELLPMIGGLLGLVFVLGGVICLVINLLGIRKIHRFAKSVYQGIITQNPEFENPRVVKNWLIFFGVCSAISALSLLAGEFMAGLSSGCAAATVIIAAIMINKYFIQDK